MAKNRTRNTTSIGFVSLGCPKNTVDSERMLADLAQAGYLVGADPAEADVVIVNTCGFIAPAREESLHAIREIAAQKKSGCVRKLVVTGCLAERMGEDLRAEVPDIDIIVGLQWRDDLVKILRKNLKRSGPQTYAERMEPASTGDDSTRLRIGPAHWAYLRISEGCDHRCSFCTIPQIRGPFRSKSPQAVVQEARELADAGVVELNLVAQDTTSYERDRQNRDGLAHLLRQLNTVAGLAWIRLMYLYPTGISDRLIEAIASSDRVVPYLDIPIQHCNNRILKAMRRPDTQERLRDLIVRLRDRIPDLVLRTTVIVGFPGETEEEYKTLMNFIQWARFEALGCFPFYPEEGTEAATLPDQIPLEIREERRDRLMRAQQEIAFAANRRRVGQSLACLIEDVEDSGLRIGRFSGQAPEIDSICLVQNCQAPPGTFVNTRVTGTEGYDLVAEADQ
jgi:ribosomal protein S12 methylthiotransferase